MDFIGRDCEQPAGRLRSGPMTASGPLLPFAVVRFRVGSEWRGRRCPVGTHAVAVSASLRIRCGARPSVASQNSLRSLRSLGSKSCDESDHEARCARRPRACAPRRHRNRPRRAAPAAQNRWCAAQGIRHAAGCAQNEPSRTSATGRKPTRGIAIKQPPHAGHHRMESVTWAAC